MSNDKLIGRLGTVEAILGYMMAGNARLTLRSVKTGTRFTYKVKRADVDKKHPDREPPTFVGVLTGPGNDTDYQFLGTIFPARPINAMDAQTEYDQTMVPAEYRHGRRSRIREDAPSARAFAWFWRLVSADVLPQDLEVWHEGSCGRCGRTLTVPESVERGIGPECIKHLAIEAINTDDLLAGLL